MSRNSPPINLLIVYCLYEKHLSETCLPEHAKQILDILRSGLFRIVLGGFGWQRTDPQRKLTQSETDEAKSVFVNEY